MMGVGSLPPMGSDLPDWLREEGHFRPTPPVGTPIWLPNDPYWQPSRYIAPLLQPIGVWGRRLPDDGKD